MLTLQVNAVNHVLTIPLQVNSVNHGETVAESLYGTECEHTKIFI
jgi:hypothetical protein